MRLTACFGGASAISPVLIFLPRLPSLSSGVSNGLSGVYTSCRSANFADGTSVARSFEKVFRIRSSSIVIFFGNTYITLSGAFKVALVCCATQSLRLSRHTLCGRCRHLWSVKVDAPSPIERQWRIVTFPIKFVFVLSL